MNDGAIIITGPSSCGKGEVSKALLETLAIPVERWISMGNILRDVSARAKSDVFVAELEERHAISDATPILTTDDANDGLRSKIKRQRAGLEAMLASRSGPRKRSDWSSATALDWLEYCTLHGLLVPNRWTQAFIADHISEVSKLGAGPLIFDGYPRTPVAAEHLLDALESARIPVWKVLHLSISKQEMLHRAGLRKRADDDPAALLARYEFYVDSVQPSVDYMKDRLGTELVALIDAHQPAYDLADGVRVFALKRSIENVVLSALRALAVSPSA